MEKVSPRYRGVLSGFLQEGYAFGYLLSAVAAYFMLDRFGWRPMFFLGGAPALLALFIRMFIRESEVWEKKRSESWRHLGRGILSQWKLWIYLTLLMAMMNFSSHGTQDVFPAFMKSYRNLDAKTTAKVVMIMMVGAIFGGVLFGLLSDRLGRRRMMITAFLGAIACVPLWAFSSTFVWISVGAFLMQFMVQGAWGIVPAHINELSPDAVRGFLPGFSYQCGNLLAATIGWMQSSLAEKHPYPHVMAFSTLLIFSLAIIAVAMGRERRGLVFGLPDDTARA